MEEADFAGEAGVCCGGLAGAELEDVEGRGEEEGELERCT